MGLASSPGEWPVTAAVWLAVCLVAGAFLCILFDLLREGAAGLSWTFLSALPADAGRAGGIASVLVSTLWILAVSISIALPLGLGTAMWLAEFTSVDGVYGRLVRRSLDVLAGVPSIVFGLFGNAFFCVYLGMGYSILAGGLTLSCMVLPLLIRSTEEGFRAVPPEYRLAAAALGVSRAHILYKVLLPAAVPGLAVGLVLGIGRALAETAALLFTSGYVARMPGSLLDSGRSLSIHIYDLSMNVPGGEANAYTSALVLVLLLLLVNYAASWASHRFLHHGIVHT